MRADVFRGAMTGADKATDQAPAEDQPWALLEIAYQCALLHHFARSRLVDAAPVDAQVRWVRSGVASNIHNGVIGTRLSGDDAIAATLRTLAGCPAIWHIDADDVPADLAERLIRAGCHPKRTAVVMGVPTPKVPAARPPTGVRITEVTDADEIGLWRRVAARVWTDSTDADLNVEADLYTSLPLGPDAPWRHWHALGVGSGVGPVGMISGLFTRATVMIEHIGVDPDRRGAGIGAALVSTVVTDAASRHIPYAVLGPTRESRPLYERLGVHPAALHPGSTGLPRIT